MDVGSYVSRFVFVSNLLTSSSRARKFGCNAFGPAPVVFAEYSQSPQDFPIPCFGDGAQPGAASAPAAATPGSQKTITSARCQNRLTALQ